MWDSKQLDALAAVAAQGSFEQAAEKLGLTASAVSQRIRALEEETGFPLITRTRPCRPRNAEPPSLADKCNRSA